MRARIATLAILGGGGIAGLALALSPALSAVAGNAASEALQKSKVSLQMLGSIGSFTPVTRDEQLAKAYAEAARESLSRKFRFTPASGVSSGERSLTVVVREGADLAAAPAKRSQPNLGLAPVTYSLGKGKGINRFVNEASAETKELNPIVESLEVPSTNFVLDARRDRFSTNLQVEARHQTAAAPTASSPQTLGTEKSYAVDLSSSYSLTKNLNVQAGVRYKGPDNRLVPLTDQQQDSQAVYVGTTFKF